MVDLKLIIAFKTQVDPLVRWYGVGWGPMCWVLAGLTLFPQLWKAALGHWSTVTP